MLVSHDWEVYAKAASKSCVKYESLCLSKASFASPSKVGGKMRWRNEMRTCTTHMYDRWVMSWRAASRDCCATSRSEIATTTSHYCYSTGAMDVKFELSWAMPVSPDWLGHRLEAYSNSLAIMNTLRLCHRFGQGPSATITKIPVEILCMIEDMVYKDFPHPSPPGCSRSSVSRSPATYLTTRPPIFGLTI
jgi:hypothetical protein